MKIYNQFLLFVFGAVLATSFNIQAQAFNPSPEQIAQFQQLPRAQQEQLAAQMGFDISVLQRTTEATNPTRATNVEFVERYVDETQISQELSKQSVMQQATAELTPFGHNLFNARNNASAPLQNMPVPSNYAVGPGDSFTLQLFGKESGTYTINVSNQGTLELPDLGPITVAGQYFQDVKARVQNEYKEQKIGVTAFLSIAQIRTIQVFLVGEVFRPGPFIVSGLSTITDALLNSGGISSIGSLRNIELKRGGKTVAYYDLYELIVFGNTANDIRLEQGDVLFVPPSINIVSIDGEVRKPAIFEIKENETVGDVLKYAGGLLPSADATNIQIIGNVAGSGLIINNVSGIDKQGLKKSLSNGDFIRVPKANLEFSNAVIINGAINLPNVMADTDLTLADLINQQTLLTSTDLNYALVLRKQKFENVTKIIQFKPLDVLKREFNLSLRSFDEILFFSKVASDIDEDDLDIQEQENIAKQNNGNPNQQLASGNTALNGNLQPVPLENTRATPSIMQSQGAVSPLVNNAGTPSQNNNFGSLYQSEFDKQIEAQTKEINRFKTLALDRQDTHANSRETLLAPVVARLRTEASNEHELQLIEVVGQVKYPGIYPLPANVSLQKILSAAGGLTESAHLESAEITSIEVDGGISTISHNTVSLLQQLALPEIQQVKLKSKDVLNVVRIPQWFENNTIELKGEVVFPGIYQISDGETISSVLKRAGGLTDKASIRAAVFSREELKQKERDNIDKAIEDLRQQLANNNLSTSQFSRTIDYQNATQVLNDLTDVEPVGRMIIDLEGVLQNSDAADFKLKDGDVLTVPNITPAISIIGEVFVPTTYLFDPALTVEDYLNLAGGIREFGDASKVYIVKANGSVVIPNRDFWFANSNQAVLEPGDTVVVPRDVTNYDNISLWQGITQIVYQSAVALAAIGNL